MARLFTDEGFNNGTAGAAINTTNSFFTGMSTQNPWTFNTENERSGPLSARCSGTGSSQYGQFATTSSLTSVYLRIYFAANAVPGATYTFMQGTASGSNRWRAYITADGRLQVTNHLTAVGITSQNMCDGKLWRIEVDVIGGTGGTITGRVYGGANVESTTFTERISGTYNSGTFNQIRFGQLTTTAPYTWWMDDVAADNAVSPGPAPALPSYSWREWSGTAETPLSVAGEWNGTSIVPLSSTTSIV